MKKRHLTERERIIVLRHLAEGLGKKEIAKKFSVSPSVIYKIEKDYKEPLEEQKKLIRAKLLEKASISLATLKDEEIEKLSALQQIQLADICIRAYTNLENKDEKGQTNNIAIFVGEDAEVRASRTPSESVAVVCTVRPSFVRDARREDNTGSMVDVFQSDSISGQESSDSSTDIQTVKPSDTTKISGNTN